MFPELRKIQKDRFLEYRQPRLDCGLRGPSRPAQGSHYHFRGEVIALLVQRGEQFPERLRAMGVNVPGRQSGGRERP